MNKNEAMQEHVEWLMKIHKGFLQEIWFWENYGTRTNIDGGKQQRLANCKKYAQEYLEQIGLLRKELEKPECSSPQ